MLHEEFGMVSIIMATYNAEKTLAQAIESVLNQTFSNFELLVIDDCSTDRTVELIKAFMIKDSRVRLLVNKENKGVSFTRKHGLDEAKGKWIAILDSDDEWLPEKLEKQIALQRRRNADLIFTGSAFMDSNGKRINWNLHVPEEITYRQLLKQNVISNSSALVRKELYERYYVMGDKMHEDFAIWLRILKEGRKAYGLDEPLLIYRISKSSKSGNKIKAAKMNWNTYQYIGLSLCETFFYECCYIMKSLMKYRNLK
ncbi:glycosyltransferase family 2 protein [Dorea sp.]